MDGRMDGWMVRDGWWMDGWMVKDGWWMDELNGCRRITVKFKETGMHINRKSLLVLPYLCHSYLIQSWLFDSFLSTC